MYKIIFAVHTYTETTNNAKYILGNHEEINLINDGKTAYLLEARCNT